MQFQIGDLVVGCNATWDFKFNGMEGVVLEGPKEYTYPTPHGRVTRLGYMVGWSSGEKRAAATNQIKPRGREDLRTVSWSDCAWNPSRLPVSESVKP